ncbi:MAG TPA: [Fe-Fe] hydrogenase large subunit C-terminal domain-containing protein [Candidatus Rifleibacterium sp.]|nr:[Fe-Fe] hydrogenase large subunit C-terminal domain-containing protein [Candidatus Rifleibacterium sp.]HPT46816.1 [Fe-Fe] hydrogenase large subunit C-terminal domain-containing protein [Candidatus Rifleibacterium sp.]
MNQLKPVFTRKADCRDCYKCVRECPVKAIKIEDNSACIVDELCIHCGRCVEVCPVGAKKVRNDVPTVKQLIELGKQVILSLAPSWRAEFRGLHASQLIASIRQLGFSQVSETAIGAQMVSQAVAELIDSSDQNLFISTACPTVVELIFKYYPEYSHYFTPVASPLVAHTRYLKAIAGENSCVAFAGPCIAKKVESERFNETISSALTFENLHDWFHEAGLNPEHFPIDASIDFFPKAACEGGLYPIDGGMISGIKSRLKKTDVEFMCFSGIEGIIAALRELDHLSAGRQIFLELLACGGGCVNGPVMKRREATILKRDSIFSNVNRLAQFIDQIGQVNLSAHLSLNAVPKKQRAENVIRSALQRVGKTSSRDELNCGSCGYDSCRDFAEALLDGKAMENMCVSYMRKLASKKANALIKAMPAGVVIADAGLRVIECNRRFASIFGSDMELVFDASPGMEGAQLVKIVPFHKVFRNVLVTGEDWVDHDIAYKDHQLNISVFSIEKGQVIGAVIQDIRVPHVRRDQVVKRVEEVIRLNLETVQKIAYLLGENASETELRLNNVLEAFGSDPEEINGIPQNYE